MCTLILGASENPARMSNKVARMMIGMGMCTYLLGNKDGEILNKNFDTGMPIYHDIDVITLYLNPSNQIKYYDYIINLNPKRIIFNPGTENEEFYALLSEKNIKFEEACTYVLLMTGQYYEHKN